MAILTNEDEKLVSLIIKKRRKYKNINYYVAKKRGGNATGIGKERSCILARLEISSPWIQWIKVWGENNEARAHEIVRLSKLN